MKIVSQKEIDKLIPAVQGKKPKAPEWYQALKDLEIGKALFISREEWKKFNYSSKTPIAWWSCARQQIRRGHRGTFAGWVFDIRVFEEGWVITKKVEKIKNYVNR